jgi:hypothetical protein
MLKRTRQLVIDNRLNTAAALALAMVDANIDNFEAAELYQSAQKAIVLRDLAARKAEAAAASAAQKQQAEETKIKQESARTYQTITNTATGKKVYLDQDYDTYYRTVTWDALIGLANLSLTSGSPAGSGAKYGLSAALSAFRHGETATFGGEFEAGVQILGLGENKLVDWYAQAVGSGAINSISSNLVLRAGFGAFSFDGGDEVIPSRTLATAVAGIGVRDLSFGNTGRLAVSADWYPGHLLTDDISFAGSGSLLAAFLLADMQSFNFYFYSGLRDTVILYNGTLRNDIKVMLAIGVGDYE